ncbi:putative spermidine/putrescine transport system permease protein/spermidine/putrescine transport system permease protein [Pararhizobium capsulatum DSM 1112]|uniref:Spermidine/putrescine transport system permease protein/spermidine/putrescine transport system permease protein n=1 Tax=Pararhizobium capsulatum DSM 1112 TaxID=1121113 RepID=A0ABU0BXB6_9HYPH|nr:ABC transporter permease [Pararhizobium capsulatum]MDQ0322903.1 putative spermidine/putrescine transport system permease protein/spermidine/putrescine transport system permease protein [Pararhizobium capsulatum DSM 1112]
MADTSIVPTRDIHVAPIARARMDAVVLRILTLTFTLFIIAYIAIPVVVTLVMSFNDAAVIRFPIKAWSLRWYADFFNSPQWVDALKSSVIIALGTTLISTVSGVLAAWAFERFTFAFKPLVYLLIMLPLFMPGVVLGLGVAMAFGDVSMFGVDIYGSRMLVILAHSLWAMPLVFMLMEATFRTVDHRIVEASYDLGGRPFQTFFEIVLPSVSTGIISSALFAFVISLNEFVMALFLTTRDTQTLPVLMWLSLRSAGTPRLAVASVILAAALFVSLSLIIVWYTRQLRKT